MSCAAKHASFTIASLSQHQSIYEYFFEHVSSYAQGHADLIPHASELPYVFHMNPLFAKSLRDMGMANVLPILGQFLLSKNGIQ